MTSNLKNNNSEQYRRKLVGHYFEMRNQIMKGINPFNEKKLDKFIESLNANFSIHKNASRTEISSLKLAS